MLEVVNGIAFFTPLWRWLRAPRVAARPPRPPGALRHRARPARAGRRLRCSSTLPLRLLYPGVPVLTISQASREDLVALGVDRERIHVVYSASTPAPLAPGPRARAEPTLLYLGRLKQYKRIELLLDVLEAIPEARLDIAGDGDHRDALEAEMRAPRAAATASTFHGHVDEDEKARLLGARLGRADRVVGRGLVPDRDGGRRVRHAERGAARRRAAARRSSTGRPACSPTTPAELVGRRARRSSRDPSAARALGAGRPRARAAASRGTHTAPGTLRCMDGAMAGRAAAAARDAARARSPARRRGSRPRRWPTTRSSSLFTVVFTRLLGADGYGTLAALISAFLILLVAGQSRAAGGRARGGARPPRPPRGCCARRCARGRASCSSRSSPSTAASVAAARAARRADRGRATCRGRPRRSCPPACCGCCSRSSAARCRGCAPTAPVGVVDRRARRPGGSCSA